MVSIAVGGYVLCVAVIVAAVWLAARRRRSRLPAPAPLVAALLKAARRRAVVAVTLSIVVIVALFATGHFLNSMVGLPVALAPALGGAAGLLLYAATPPSVLRLDPASARAASLTPRTPLSFVPGWGAALLATVAVAQVVFLVFTGATSSADESGRYRAIAFHTADAASSSSPYAGWFYGVPLLGATAILVAAVLLALWRVSSTPALPQRELAAVDAGWRRTTNRIIVSVGIAALLLQFGSVAIPSGLAIGNAAFEGVPADWQTIGRVFTAGGLAMMAGSIVGLTLAALWAFALPDLARRRRTPNGVRGGAPTSEGIPQ